MQQAAGEPRQLVGLGRQRVAGRPASWQRTDQVPAIAGVVAEPVRLAQGAGIGLGHRPRDSRELASVSIVPAR